MFWMLENFVMVCAGADVQAATRIRMTSVANRKIFIWWTGAHNLTANLSLRVRSLFYLTPRGYGATSYIGNVPEGFTGKLPFGNRHIRRVSLA